MIRHQDSTCSRPIAELSLIAKIEAGELAQKDEICVSGGYWFSIQDVSEVRKFFGEIKLERNLPNDGETSTTIQGNAKTLVNAVPESQAPAQQRGAEPMPGKSSFHKGSKPMAQASSNSAYFEALEEESEVSIWSQIALILVIVLIFSGTVYLLWTNSRK
jgi:hypothetical protein